MELRQKQRMVCRNDSNVRHNWELCVFCTYVTFRQVYVVVFVTRRSQVEWPTSLPRTQTPGAIVFKKFKATFWFVRSSCHTSCEHFRGDEDLRFVLLKPFQDFRTLSFAANRRPIALLSENAFTVIPRAAHAPDRSVSNRKGSAKSIPLRFQKAKVSTLP
eukprot:5543482-Pleurochrysis_carterae.AAC.3